MIGLGRFRAVVSTGWVGYAGALAAVALASIIVGFIGSHVHLANLSMLYLIAVIVTAVFFGSGPAVLASVAAFLAFNFLFVEPRHTFAVSNPGEWVALFLLLLTGIIIGQLAAALRRRAQQAEQREREAVVLYDVVRLMGEPDLGHALQSVAERLREELRLAAVVVEVVAGDGCVASRAEAGDREALQLTRLAATEPALVLGPGPSPTVSQRGAPGRWIRTIPPRAPHLGRTDPSDRLHIVPVKSQDRRMGTLYLVRPAEIPGFTTADDRLLSAVAAQLGLAVERAWLRREATETEVLRRTDELKTALLNAVSHDLRTPLASIIASAGSLLQNDVSWTEQERQEFAEAIEQEARRLNQIVGNLLDLSRMEAGSLRVERGWYDLGALVDDVLGRLRPITAQHRLVVNISEDLPPVPLDYVQIDQVLSNLIENAAKYAPSGSEISIVAQSIDGEVQVEVADRGPGIPPAALPRLFERFYRVDGPRPRPRGTGLGLAVAKGLVEAHGGRIWAENRSGGGAHFAFTLPLVVPEISSAGKEESL